MATRRRYSSEFKRQVVQEYQAGEALHGLAKRHGMTTSPRPTSLQEDEARIGARSSWSARWRSENEFLKRTSRQPTDAAHRAH